MSDDKSQQADGTGDDEYEVRFFAERYGISEKQAHELIDRLRKIREALGGMTKTTTGERKYQTK